MLEREPHVAENSERTGADEPGLTGGPCFIALCLELTTVIVILCWWWRYDGEVLADLFFQRTRMYAAL